jgi:hypothetical protein
MRRAGGVIRHLLGDLGRAKQVAPPLERVEELSKRRILEQLARRLDRRHPLICGKLQDRLLRNARFNVYVQFDLGNPTNVFVVEPSVVRSAHRSAGAVIFFTGTLLTPLTPGTT